MSSAQVESGTGRLSQVRESNISRLQNLTSELASNMSGSGNNDKSILKDK